MIVGISALMGTTLTTPKKSNLKYDDIRTTEMKKYPVSEKIARAWFVEMVLPTTS